MKKSLISSAVVAALGLTVGVAEAASVTGLVIQDVGSNTANGAGNYSSTQDGVSGAFKFAPINVVSYAGASQFTGDVGTGTMLGNGAANPTGSFTTGFIFSGAPFVPFTFGSGFDADITGGALTINSLDFGGNFGGGQDFLLAPDAGTLDVLWVNQDGLTAGGNDYNVAFRWSHDITSAEDPSLAFTSFSARWVLEGVATVEGTTNPVPVPAAVWLFGSGLAGIAGVARRRKARKS